MVRNRNDRNSETTTEEQKRAELWMRHGIEDVYFQREAQVNFWTVLGGIAVAALLTEIPSLLDEIQLGRWHLMLYALTVLLLIAASWVQNLWGSMILRMQVNYLYVILWLLNMVSLSIMSLQVTNPAVFFMACGAFLLFTLLFQVYLMRSGAWVAYNQERVKAIKSTLWIYFLIMVLCFGAATHLTLHSAITAEIGWGFFAFLSSIGAIVMHHFGMKEERKEIGVP